MRHLLIYLLVTLFFACHNEKDKANSHLIIAKAFFEQKDYLSSSKEIELAKKLDSSNSEIIFLDAQLNYQTSSYGISIKLFNSLISKNYKVDTSYRMLGENYLTIGNNYEYQKGDSVNAKLAYQNAIKYFDSALNKNMHYFQAYIGKIKGYHNNKKHDDAISTISKALLMFPDSSLLIFYRGAEKQSLGDNLGGFNDLSDFMKKDKLDSSDLASAYRFRSFFYLSKDSLDKAIDDLTMAISYNPEDEFLYVNRGYCYKNKKQKDEACKDFRKAGDLGFITIYEEIRNYCEQK